MKKILLSAIVAIFALQLNAQVCNQYAPTVAGAKSYILPDSATGIQHACVGRPYDQVMNIKVFKDTLIGGLFTATVDSVIINLDIATIGLPAGFTIASVPAMLPPNALHNYNHLTLKGDSIGCVRITGIAPTTASTIPLTIPFKIKAKVGGFIDTSVTLNNTNYELVIDPIGTGFCYPAGVADAFANLQEITALPNPTNQNLSIRIHALKKEKVCVDIHNMYGQLVSQKIGTLQNGDNQFVFDVSNYTNGVYTYTISNGTNKVTNKWVKQ
jgi:hypothetical protein